MDAQQASADDFYNHPRAVQIFKFEPWCQPTSNAENGQQPQATTSSTNKGEPAAFTQELTGIVRDVKADASQVTSGIANLDLNTRTGTRRPLFDHESLQKILCHPSVRDVLIVPICVAGSYRSGKSFLMNFLLRYLNSLPTSDGEEYETKDATPPATPVNAADGPPTAAPPAHAWLGGEEAKADDGFAWRLGSESHTEGIWVWSRAIRVRHGGKDYAVVLLDTQGTHDMKASEAENIMMLAISSLLSSVFIYNVRGGLIGSDILQQLSFFVNYGEIALNGPPKRDESDVNNNDCGSVSVYEKSLLQTQEIFETDKTNKPFQHLVFLVRDWQNPNDHQYGQSPRYLDYVLDVNGAGGQQYCKKTRAISQQIRSYFERTSCFLMPTPGECVTEAKFQGQLNQASSRFQEHFPEFVQAIMSADITRAKRIGNETVTCSNLCSFALNCVTLLQTAGEIPTASAIYDMQWQSQNRLAIDTAVEAYDTHMMAATVDSGSRLNDASFKTIHCAAFQTALHVFNRRKFLGSVSSQTDCHTVFTGKIDVKRQFYERLNSQRRDLEAENKILKAEIEAEKKRKQEAESSNNFYDYPRAVQIFKFLGVPKPQQCSGGEIEDDEALKLALQPAEAHNLLAKVGSVAGRGASYAAAAARRALKASTRVATQLIVGPGMTNAAAGNRPCAFEHENLKKILCHESVKNCQAVVICVAGAFRSGKSLILDFMLRYLNSLAVDADENNTSTYNTNATPDTNDGQSYPAWLGDKTVEAADGFARCSGCDGYTEGIWAWSRAIKIRQNGKDYAVVLLETQGAFDMKTSSGETSVMFALSNLLSSVMIFNVNGGRFGSDVLQQLQFCLEYGSKASSTDKGFRSENPFQELLFLVRDWNKSGQYPYGKSDLYMKNVLNIDQAAGTPYCFETNARIAQQLFRCYDKMSCYLLPHPGNCATKSKFRGELSKVDEEFALEMSKFVESILDASLSQVTCSELYKFAVSCVATLNDPQRMPQASSSWFSSYWYGVNRFALECCMDVYENCMLTLGWETHTLSIDDFYKLHKNAVENAWKEFDRQDLWGTPSDKAECRRGFERGLELRKDRFDLLKALRGEVTTTNLYWEIFVDMENKQKNREDAAAKPWYLGLLEWIGIVKPFKFVI